MYGGYLLTALLVTSILGALSAAILRNRDRICSIVSFGIAAVSACTGLACSVYVLFREEIVLAIPGTMPFGNFAFSVDRLSAFFILTISLLSLCVSIYSIGYTREYYGKYNIGLMGLLYNLFFMSMIMVVTASGTVMFLIVWELMSLLSYLLVVYENRDRGSVSSGLLYLVMTHAGTAFITLSFLMMASQSGSLDFASFNDIGSAMPELFKSLVFVFLLIGFGTKAGIIPLHVWLPYAHPTAPSNVSAMMSGVMVKTAIYMLIRCFFDFLGVTDTWWGILVLLIASVSALLGVMYALMETDLKRLLAYSTVENIGIILIALGAAMIFKSYGLADLSALALIAALFHVLNHALFKGLLFMGAGSVLFATHTKNIEKLGGLAKKMPWTGAFFFIGALSISAIPPLNGFVSEWLIFQSLLLSFNFPEMMIKILLPVSMGMLALTGAMAAACFVRAYGITFLAQPRTEHAEHAKEVPSSMLLGMGMAAALCVLTGVLSIYIVPVIDRVTSSVLGVSIASKMVYGLVMSPAVESFSSVSTVGLAALMIILLPAVYLFTKFYGGRRKVTVGDTWDCGTALSPRMEYTGTAFSQPINRFFNSIYFSKDEFRSNQAVSPYLKKNMAYARRMEPVFEKYLYNPVVNATVKIAHRAHVIQRGSIQAYLAYIFITLVALLIIFR